MLYLLTTFALAAQAPEPPLVVASEQAEALADFEKFHHQAQVAETALMISTLGLVPLTVVALMGPGNFTRPELALIAGPLVLGAGMYAVAIPWMVVAGRKAERALGGLGGTTRPRINQAAVLSYGLGLGTFVLGTALLSSGRLSPAAVDVVVPATVYGSVGFVTLAIPFCIAQLEHLNRHDPGGASQGSRVHRVLVAPLVWGQGVGLVVSGR
ncbi:MAG: hypothetical protein ACI9VR_003190 [Cognaticolwellia sp.]|jgi:hypothetical protein